MNINPATHPDPEASGTTVAGADTTTTPGVSYHPGGSVAVVAPGTVLLVSGGRDDVARLYETVCTAVDARAVLAAATGGRVLDLDALPDLALAHRGPAGLRVLLSGRARCTVVEDGAVTELDGADVALLGEWGFPAAATVELSVHDAAEGEPGWPVTAGVVPADRVRWVARSETTPGSNDTGASAAAAESVPVREPVPGPSPAPFPDPSPGQSPEPLATDATLLPEDTAAPAPVVPAAAAVSGTQTPTAGDPDPTPDSDRDRDRTELDDDDLDDVQLDDVEYTIGGGIDYDRMFRPAQDPTPAPTPAPGAAPSPGPPPAPAPAPIPASAAFLATPDLGGDTVSPAAAAALRGGLGGAEPEPVAESAAEVSASAETAARLCPQNHANPPRLSGCRICGAPLDGPTVRIARPSLGVVRLSTGMFFDLDRPLLLGREPRLDGVEADSAPRLIILPSPDKAISRTHLRVDIDGWSAHAVDLGSINGTYLRRGAADEVRLMPEEPKMLMSGDILVVDDVRVRFEDLP